MEDLTTKSGKLKWVTGLGNSLYVNKLRVNVSTFVLTVVLFLYLFNFMILAEFRFINASFIRYPIFMLGLTFILMASHSFGRRLDLVVILCTAFIFFVLFLNFYHSASLTVLSFSILLVPFFILFFDFPVKARPGNFFLYFIAVLNILFLVYSFKKLNYINLQEAYVLNANEIATYSFIVLIFLSFMYDIFFRKNIFAIWVVYVNFLITLFVSVVMDARFVQISLVVLFFLFIMRRTPFKYMVLLVMGALSFILPLLIVLFSQEIKTVYGLFQVSRGVPIHVINADSDRLDMYLMICEVMSQSFFGKGIGFSGYFNYINISGLHSAPLDLMYWGGVILYSLFFIMLLSIVFTSKYKKKYFLSSSVLIYLLIYSNYFEGIFFGNMGILLVVLFMFSIFYRLSKV